MEYYFNRLFAVYNVSLKKMKIMLRLSFFFSFAFCISSALAQQNANSKLFVLGEIQNLNSQILKENRILNIYLPEGYNRADTVKYPVIYLLDGSADEDFIHIAGLLQFCNFEWVNIWPKSILVGIASVNRRRDFTFPTSISSDKTKYPESGNSSKFISFIENELQPFINSKYNTSKIKTIIGQSLGGLLATEILLKKPFLFNNYIVVSPSIWWNNGSILNTPTDSVNFRSVNVFVAVGKEGLTPTAEPRVMEVDANLLVEKLRHLKANVIFDFLPQEDHATIMHQAVFNAFKQLSKFQ